jgi:hypothetical protein
MLTCRAMKKARKRKRKANASAAASSKSAVVKIAAGGKESGGFDRGVGTEQQDEQNWSG